MISFLGKRREKKGRAPRKKYYYVGSAIKPFWKSCHFHITNLISFTVNEHWIKGQTLKTDIHGIMVGVFVKCDYPCLAYYSIGMNIWTTRFVQENDGFWWTVVKQRGTHLFSPGTISCNFSQRRSTFRPIKKIVHWNGLNNWHLQINCSIFLKKSKDFYWQK